MVNSMTVYHVDGNKGTTMRKHQLNEVAVTVVSNTDLGNENSYEDMHNFGPYHRENDKEVTDHLIKLGHAAIEEFSKILPKGMSINVSFITLPEHDEEIKGVKK